MTFRHLGLLALMATLVSATPSRAEDVRVTVVAIHATERNKDVDEDLKAIAETVQKKEPKLTGFRKGRTTAMKVTVGAKEKTFPLVDNEVLTVSIESISDKLHITVKPPTLQSVTYRAPPGKFFPIVTSYETKDKDRLIMAIMYESEE